MSLVYPLTFLDMLQRLHFETGTSGVSPSSVTGQTDQISRLVMWLSTAWVEIQSAHQDWDYLRATATFATVAGQGVYTRANCGITAGTFGKWIPWTFRNYLTTAGITNETYMDMTEYDSWRNQYQYGALRNVQTRPFIVAVAPDKSLCVGPFPNALYTILGDYFIAPQPLLVDADTPTSVSASVGAGGSKGEIPTQWNMAIVYKAMMSYGTYESAPDTFKRGKDGYEEVIQQLDHDRIPQCRVGGALA